MVWSMVFGGQAEQSEVRNIGRGYTARVGSWDFILTLESHLKQEEM